MVAWESALFYLWRRFCFHRPGTEESEQYYDELSRQETAMNDLLLRWLKTVKLFLEHGADAKIIVLDQDRSKRHRWSFKLSALSIFNGVFSDFDDPLKSSTQQLLLSKRRYKSGGRSSPKQPFELGLRKVRWEREERRY